MPPRISFRYLPLLFIPLFLRFTAAARPFVLVISNDDLIKDYAADSLPSESEWDDFSPLPAAFFVDPWISILDPSSSDLTTSNEFSSSLSDLVASFSSGDPEAASGAAAQIAAEASAGVPAAQSVIGFLYGAGVLRKPDRARHFMYHSFAADGGDMHSKMALAYSYFRQEVSNVSCQRRE
jgi:SEL1 protein